MSYERTVELQRWPGIGFGFSVIGGSDTHITPMICALVRDSPALKSNEVKFMFFYFCFSIIMINWESVTFFYFNN